MTDRETAKRVLDEILSSPIDDSAPLLKRFAALCDKICGVNFSVGYYNEHHKEETLVFDEWYNTLCVIEKMISPPQKRFLLAGS